MKEVFSRKVIFVLPTIFLVLLLLKIYYNYLSAQEYAYDFAKKEAEVLGNYSLEHRNYYQNLYINGYISLNEKTLLGLPAHSSSIISNRFSKNNIFNIVVRGVSDRPRNIINKADKLELKAIEYFDKNKDKDEYFSSNNGDFYQYARVLRITPVCLMCHGKKEDAPQFIQEKYDKSYNYKLEDVRGIISIKLPKDKINKLFLEYFLSSSFYDILLLLVLFIIVFYLSKKAKKANTILEEEIKRKKRELGHTVMHDRLTKLPNRLFLLEDLDCCDKSYDNHLAILNIDSFKDINDLYGHDVGDTILTKIANILKEVDICNNSKIYKLPSDEFALLSRQDVDKEGFIKNIKNIISLIQDTKYNIEGNSIFVRVTCGIASNKQKLLIKADMALKSAKSLEKSFMVYEDSLDRKVAIEDNMKGMTLLKNAIQNDTLVPYYQPIYDISLNKITKYEALVRIVEGGKVIPPIEFLDIAYRAKFYPHMTKSMIKKTFDFFKDSEYEFSINLSILDIKNQSVCDFIVAELIRYNNSNNVVFEILEDDKIDDYSEVNRFIKEVKKYGVKIAIDDFGKGYSNFSHLVELEIDYLKIDGSLVKNLLIDENSLKIVQTIVLFAKKLGIKTIAEYVENEDILKSLDKTGVDFAQGYHIGKPKPTLS